MKQCCEWKSPQNIANILCPLFWRGNVQQRQQRQQERCNSLASRTYPRTFGYQWFLIRELFDLRQKLVAFPGLCIEELLLMNEILLLLILSQSGFQCEIRATQKLCQLVKYGLLNKGIRTANFVENQSMLKPQNQISISFSLVVDCIENLIFEYYTAMGTRSQ